MRKISEQILNQILSKLTELESNMATKQDIEDIKVKIDGVSEQVAKNAEDLEVIKEQQSQIKQATIDSREDITLLIEGQERQDKILESLSLRSLEQETDIRDLKRIK